jgi:hypothetical protein
MPISLGNKCSHREHFLP